MGRFLDTSLGQQLTFLNFAVALILTGCGKAPMNIEVTTELEDTNGASADQPKLSPFDVNQYPLNKLVCDPMSTPPEQSTLEGGLHGALYYMPAGAPIFSSVQNYFTSGILSEQYMFFSQINVPTRMFDKGFPLETGGLVQNDL
ncbi:MAG: hypothetical protein K2X47_18550, partial [Bdellovibrionales bacterium]|nr:hypothetical protein [Bdellovibrionales bacterium]